MRFVLCVLALAIAGSAGDKDHCEEYSPLVTEYEWKYIDFMWDEQHQKDDYVKKGLYDYKNVTPLDVDRSRDGRTFVTIVKSAGVPATLATISNQRDESGPLLMPYPDWSWHSDRDCQKIIAPYRVTIDECDRIWVLDSGVLDDVEYICPAKLLVFNLSNDQLVFTHEIPDSVARNKNGTGLLITPVVESYGYGCTNFTVYMADAAGFGMVIYNGHRTYRLEAKEFQAESQNANFTIAGESFSLEDGIFGMALTPMMHNPHSRFMAFRPVASKSIYVANTEVLRRSVNGHAIKYRSGYDVLPSQATTMAFSSEGTLFYVLTGETAIGCWNANKPMEDKNFGVALRDPERLQFASGLKVINDTMFPGNNQYVLIMTNRLQKIMTGTMDFNETNYRVTRASVSQIINGTVCDRY